MSPSEEAAKVCPNCGIELIYSEEYGKDYCVICDEYFEPVEEETKEDLKQISAEPTPTEDEETDELKKRKIPAPPEEKKKLLKYRGRTRKLKAVEEETKEDLKHISAEPTPSEDEETDEPKKRMIPPPPEEEKKVFSDYRYRTRMLKGSILPILYGVISIQMLNRYIFEFPGYFKYEMMWILVGFLIGFGGMSGITLANLIRAKKNPDNGCILKSIAGVIVFIPFIIILLTLAFFYGISTAWQFSTGFFLATIFPLLFVTLFEVGTKGKFFVREVKDDPSGERKLVFIQQ